MADRLTDETTRHWTGTPHPLTSLVLVDGKAFRIMGAEPASEAPMRQKSLEFTPTRTIYEFEDAGVLLKLTFLTPALPDRLEVMSWPVTYLTWEVKSTDGKEHQVTLYYDHTGELVVNEPRQKITWEVEAVPGLKVLKMGSKDQPILVKKGDNLRIDWGYLYLSARQVDSPVMTVAEAKKSRELFVTQGTIPLEMDARKPRAAQDATPAAVCLMNLGKVSGEPVERTLVLAYDDLYSIQYFMKNLRPYWRRNGMSAQELLMAATRDFVQLRQLSVGFDIDFIADMQEFGGIKYARLGALAYRQTLAGNKIVADANGQPLIFPKENFSNGCIGTVDVIYPMAPFFLLFGPSMTKAMLVSNLDYARSPRWKFPFAPHDLGTYPKANGQVYGGGEDTEENQMPVEETGNMIILVTALAQMEGNASFAAQYWNVLVKWAEYLKAKGFDPENQLCTDDFAGHLAHNVNLSAKAIVALGAFGKLCDLKGDKKMGETYRNLAKEYAARWVKEADDGTHFRLAFDKPGSWSQKYNLVWDRILGLDLFPKEALRKEMNFYKQNLDKYGLALDSRKPYTKLDWTIWTATLTWNKDDFMALVEPVFKFLDETQSRVPMSDWYWVKDAKKAGFQARPVVGGVYLPFLNVPRMWNKWSARDTVKANNWAALPEAPKMVTLVPAANKAEALWKYTEQKPTGDWFAVDYDSSTWKEGLAGFGAGRVPKSKIRTPWKSSDVWLRREIEMPQGPWTDVHLLVYHDEDVEIYINGVLAVAVNEYTTIYEALPINVDAKITLIPGKNTFAVHCTQTDGGQYVDLGVVDLVPVK
jgi:hypothetical protein